tara:strand:- start:871 stop:1701 length:831 start_codon:yes stop_codon:yes gene_type:complete
MKNFILLSIVSMIHSCGNNESLEKKLAPKTQFKEPLKKKKFNLTNRLGEYFQTIENSDTITYEVFFNNKSKENTITRMGDTIFQGYASRIGFKYCALNNPLPNGNFRITGIRLTDSTITDLRSEYNQAYSYDDMLSDSANHVFVIDSGSYQLIDASKKTRTLFFKEVVDKTKKYKLVNYMDDPIEEKIDIQEYNNQTLLTSFVAKIAPNPAKKFIEIFSNNSVLKPPFTLINQEGSVLKEGILTERTTKLDISNLAPGTYILKLTNSEESYKIIKL